MPRCEGLPTGPCPGGRNDGLVCVGEGDLLLCRDCDKERHRLWLESRNAVAASNSVSENTSSTTSETALSSGEGISTSKRAVEVNELLCFLNSKFHNHPLSLIKKSMIDFYREDEVFTAKQILVQAVRDKGLPIQQYTKKRISDHKIKTTLDDIANIWSVIDENNFIERLPIFCAADLSRIPVLTDELSDIALIRKTVVDLESQVHALADSMATLNVSAVLPSTCKSSNIQTDAGHDVTPVEMVANTIDGSVSESTSVTQGPQQATTEVTDASNYADAVRRPAENTDNEGYQSVQGKKRRQKSIVGNNSHGNQFQGVARKSVFCVNRLEAGTTVEAVTEYLSSQNIDVSSCFLVHSGSQKAASMDHDTSHTSKFIAMRLCVLHKDGKKVLDPELWPVGVTVRPWIFKSGERRSNS